MGDYYNERQNHSLIKIELSKERKIKLCFVPTFKYNISGVFPGFLFGMFCLLRIFQTSDVFYIVCARVKNRATSVRIVQSHSFNFLELSLADNKQ